MMRTIGFLAVSLSTAVLSNPATSEVSREVKRLGFVLAEKGNFSPEEIAYRYLFRKGERDHEEVVLLLCSRGKDSKVTGITYGFPAKADTTRGSRAHAVFLSLSRLVTPDVGADQQSTFFEQMIDEVRLTTSFRGELGGVTFAGLSKDGKIGINIGGD
jgi:hypothetical protein